MPTKWKRKCPSLQASTGKCVHTVSAEPLSLLVRVPMGYFYVLVTLIPVKDPSEGIGRPAQLRAPKQGSSENPLHPGGAPGPSATFPEEPW